MKFCPFNIQQNDVFGYSSVDLTRKVVQVVQHRRIWDVLKVDDVEDQQLNILEIVVGHLLLEHIENETLCRLDVDPIVVERTIVRHVVDDFIKDTMSFPSDFDETNALFNFDADAFYNMRGTSLMPLNPILVLLRDDKTLGTWIDGYSLSHIHRSRMG
ncbi:uncharacterized protein E5676_scaffold451G00840 [Cucumis melo var. makuwa]|uniref:Uncharacterized protein n=1 Tax=Cucumis melo var. makuwa TaxID=1194695 RepID=A0A5A7UP41_CUCMM|nr:uncharacterized protein E6C27_scaffold323G00160 [Cucumis melo var. makuwa]TYK01522.1 uncharacterized protein E5676_scaffold451G00840 [Cucumis melo var. makuwa]